MRVFILVAAALPFAALAQDASTAAASPVEAMPAWMAGCWQRIDGERWTEECWTIPRGGQMLGSGRAGMGETVGSFEFMRIERGGQGLTFHGGPRGQGWIEFRGGSDVEGDVTFANPAHDFPQRVRYWREGERMMAEVSLADGTNAQRWSFSQIAG